MLEIVAREVGVEFFDGKVSSAEPGPAGIAAVRLENGQGIEADYFVDASGFRGELLGKVLDEPILAYTTVETMDAGWASQIEHEHHINRGYVFSSQAISDDEAAAEFIRKNPQAPKSPRIVKFRSGCYRRQWVDNVVAVGNAGGFVEPLEAIFLMIVCTHTRTLVEFLPHSDLEPTPTMRDLYNELTARTRYDIRDFLLLHYKLNTKLDTRSGATATRIPTSPASTLCSSSTRRMARPAFAVTSCPSSKTTLE